MTTIKDTPLAEWLRVEAARRHWSMRYIALQSGFSNTTISGIANGDNTTPEVCKALAKVFGVTEEEVLVRAGILPDRGDILPEVAEWSNWLRELTPERRSQVVAATNQVFALLRPLAQPDQGASPAGLASGFAAALADG
jgi:transcriptional regulator with XRE-family HTH domain